LQWFDQQAASCGLNVLQGAAKKSLQTEVQFTLKRQVS